MANNGTYIPIFDPGHGGMFLGDYRTPGKRSPKFGEYPVLYEGASNRALVARMKELCDFSGIPYAETVCSPEDMPLWKRCELANKIGKEIYKRGFNPYLISVHSNAGGGKGFEVWTSPGETMSDKIATKWVEKVEKWVPGVRMRKDMSDGDPDKESKFQVLVGTNIPAILTENLFMDTYGDFCYLRDANVRNWIARAHYYMIEELYTKGI